MIKFRKHIFVIIILSLLLFGHGNGCTPGNVGPKRRISDQRAAVFTKKPRGTVETSTRPSFSFVVLGDSRPATSALPQPGVFRRLINQINHENPDLVFHTGDVVAGETKSAKVYAREYRDFLTVMSALRAPYHIAPGNHDVDSYLGEKIFRQLLQRDLYYSFNHKGSHFIILDTETLSQPSKTGQDQLEWLRQDLENNKSAKHIFVIMHRPLYSVMNLEGKKNKHIAFTDKRNEYEIKNLMVQYQVDAVFAGHEHFFNKQTHDGVMYIITGAAGAFPYTDEGHGGFYHYVTVKVEGNSVYMQVMRLGGRTINPDSVPTPVFK